MVFTAEQKAYCVAEWSLQRKFRARFDLGGFAKVLSHSRIKEWHQKFMMGASANRKKRENSRFVLTPQKKQEVVARNPHLSTRNLDLQEQMPSRTSIPRVLKEAKWHPYKLQLHHQVNPRNNNNEETRFVTHTLSSL